MTLTQTAGSRERITPRWIALVSLQLAGGLLTFLAWSLVSKFISAGEVAHISTAYAWGMSAYLPLTLGLPFVLPNFQREPGRGHTLWSLRLLIGIAVTALCLGLVLGAAPVFVGGRPSDLSIAACLAGYAVLAITLQQQARIHLNARWLMLAATLGSALPLSSLIANLLTNNRLLTDAVTLFALTAGAVLMAVILHRSEDGIFSGALPRFDLSRVLRVATPLVPHMAAFGVLLQGTRLSATLSPSHSVASVSISNYEMIILGVGFTVIAGVHGLLATGIQRAEATKFRADLPRYALCYGALGTVGSIGVVVAFRWLASQLLDGMPTLGSARIAGLAIIPPAICCYYLFSSILVRGRRTAPLAAITVTGAALFLAVSVGTPLTDTERELFYEATMLALPLIAIPVAVRLRSVSPRTALRLIAATAPSFIPAVVIAMIAAIA